MKIHPVNHAKGDTNRYCGPSALSIVTGMSTGEAARLLRTLSGAAAIKGTTTGQMSRAFRTCGINMVRIKVKHQAPAIMRKVCQVRRDTSETYTETRPTMTQWLKDSKDIRTPGRVFLIDAGHHWQIVSGRRFCCGRTGKIVSITDKKANRRARVSGVYELVGDKIAIPPCARKPKATIDPYRKRLMQVEKENGFKGRLVMNIGVKDYEVPPCDTFPHGFSTMHHDWSETLGRVLHCMDPEVYASLADNDYHYSGE